MAGTSGLTASERGVYITILAMIYEARGTVALDRTRLSRRCGLPSASFKRVLAALLEQGKLVKTEHGITNRRAEIELGERETEYTKRQLGAQITNATLAEKRNRNNDGADAERNAERTLRALAQDPEPEPDKEREALSACAPAREADIVAIPGGKAIDRDTLHKQLLDLLSRYGGIPAKWINPAAGIRIGHWLDALGLTPGEVLRVAESNLAHYGRAPGGPEWWDRAMADFAAAKAAPPPEPSSQQPRRGQDRPDVADIIAKLERDRRI